MTKVRMFTVLVAAFVLTLGGSMDVRAQENDRDDAPRGSLRERAFPNRAFPEPLFAMGGSTSPGSAVAPAVSTTSSISVPSVPGSPDSSASGTFTSGWRDPIEFDLRYGAQGADKWSGSIMASRLRFPLYTRVRAGGRSTRIGLAVHGSRYEGEHDDEAVEWSGEKLLGGFTYTFSRWGEGGGSQFNVEALFGERTDQLDVTLREVFSRPGRTIVLSESRERQKQESDVAALLVSYDRHWMRKTLPRISLYSWSEWDIDHELTERPTAFASEAVNRDYFSAGVIADLRDVKNGFFRPRLGVEGSYVADGHHTRVSPIVGLSFFHGAFDVTGKYEYGARSHTDDQWTAEVRLDVVQLFRGLFRKK